MIENFSKEELKILVEELKSAGYQMDQQAKCTIFDNCVKEEFGIETGRRGLIKKLQPLFFDIADLMTNNFIVKWVNSKDCKHAHVVKNKFVPSDKSDTYKSVMLSVMDAIKPYFDDASKGYEERNNKMEKMRQENLVEKYGR